MNFEKVYVVSKKSALQGLIARYGTKSQAEFVLAKDGLSIAPFVRADNLQRTTIERFCEGLPSTIRVALVDFDFLPSYQFDPHALVVTVGVDGLVANTAKYLTVQPILAINPDPFQIDGTLARNSFYHALSFFQNSAGWSRQKLTMAEAKFPDGQRLLAVNDLFIGQKTHVSARYTVRFKDTEENQSSSGIIVSTGTGATGWRKSIITGARSLVAGIQPEIAAQIPEIDAPVDPGDPTLTFAVREPFPTKSTQANLVWGRLVLDETLTVTSQMPQNGVIFSDGVELDFLEFNAGTVATIGVAEEVVHLLHYREIKQPGQ